MQWLGLQAEGLGSVPGQEAKIPQATQCSQKKRKKLRTFTQIPIIAILDMLLTEIPGSQQSLQVLGGCSVTKLCLTVCDPMDCSTPGFPVLHYIPKFAQV